jgi:hypothetical protein
MSFTFLVLGLISCGVLVSAIAVIIYLLLTQREK